MLLNMQLVYLLVHAMLILVNHIKRQMENATHFTIGTNLLKEVVLLQMVNAQKLSLILLINHNVSLCLNTLTPGVQARIDANPAVAQKIRLPIRLRIAPIQLVIRRLRQLRWMTLLRIWN